MIRCGCGKPVESGRAECFRCRVSTVGFTFNGGALQGRAGFKAMTRTDFLREHLRVDSEKELAKRPGVERYDPDAKYWNGED